jgi:single-strand DNA-binding protein
MSSVNKAQILGRLGADPELRHTASGQAVCELRVAASEKYRDKNEQMQERYDH